jgi:predicted RNA-binding protein YlxR (DUF448 family)/ribosomal protein L7Ae-like RNA K-turn-binding protein
VEASVTSESKAQRAEAQRVSERTCAGWREVAPRETLVRFAFGDVGERGIALVPDVMGKLGGRGVSVHPTPACIEAAVKRGGFAKAASAKVDAEPAALIGALVQQLDGRARGLLLGALRGKLLTLGGEATSQAIAERKIAALVLARDASDRTSEVGETVRRLGRHVAVLGDKKSLGALVGRDELAVIGVMDDGVGQALAEVAATIARLHGDETNAGPSTEGTGDDGSKGRQGVVRRGSSTTHAAGRSEAE